MLNRLALRILKLKARRADNTRAVKAIDRLMKDRELLEVFNEYLASEFYGSPFDLLDWLSEHWEEILNAILKIIDLFSDE